jgi:hypothetical protein
VLVLVLCVVLVLVSLVHVKATFDPMNALQAYGNTFCGSVGLSYFSTGTEYNVNSGYPCMCQVYEGGNWTWCGYPYMCVGHFAVPSSPSYYNIQQTPGDPFIFTEYFNNNSTANNSFNFQRSESTSNSYTWSNSESIYIGESLSVTAGLPGICEVHDQFEFDLSLNTTETQTGSDTQNWSVSETIGIPAESTVRVDVVIATTSTNCDFTAQVTFNPNAYGNIWCNNVVNGHYEWFIGAGSFLEGTFGGAVCNYGACNVTGTFTALQGVTVYVNVTQCPLGVEC